MPSKLHLLLAVCSQQNAPSGSKQPQSGCELRTANDRRKCAVRELNRLKTVTRFARAASSVLQFPK